ncbi:MAG TPA: hypothetical protein PKI68_08105, partial [Pontiellaceae bacterium]|nr:hypothetical protein [Pontiellaceae bacterium]
NFPALLFYPPVSWRLTRHFSSQRQHNLLHIGVGWFPRQAPGHSATSLNVELFAGSTGGWR